MVKNVSVKVNEVNNEDFEIFLNPDGFTMSKERFNESFNFNEFGCYASLLHNMKVRAELDNVTIDNFQAFKSCIEANSFKVGE